jgi:cell division protein FtsZ
MTDDLMSFEIPSNQSSIIKVIGVGGGGSNAVNYMYGLGIKDVNFVVCNTDAQALASSPVPVKVRLGETLTEGRGAGNKPDKGKQAAIESSQEIARILEGNTKMVFITAGMGGGTGTGAAPIIAKTAREMGILTVGIVTIPFKFEGRVRITQAIDGIGELEKNVDSLLIINNEKLREMYGDLKLSNAFSKADNVLATAAKGIAEIITVHGYINVDFADVETVMKDSGVAIMGSGTGVGEYRAIDAIQSALESPLLNNNNILGASNILLNITSGINEITMDEVGQITDYVQEIVGKSVDSVIWGTGNDETLTDEVVVTIIATGFAYSNMVEPTPKSADKQITRLELDSDGNLCTSGSQKSKDHDDEEIELGDLPPRVVTFSDIDSEKERRIDLLYGTTSKKPNPEPEDDKDSFSASPDNSGFQLFVRQQDGTSVQIDPEDLMDEKVIEEMENIPAYKRRKIQTGGDSSGQPEAKVSRFSISDDGLGKPKISKNNRFLHDNVD